MSDEPRLENLGPHAIELVAARFRLLADPTRLRILQALRDGERTVGALAEACEITQPNVSKHLRMLGEGGVVHRRQVGNSAWFSIADDSILAMCDVVCAGLRQHLNARASMLDERQPG
jgi:DNA-binding transcriptional ArsR family regulator